MSDDASRSKISLRILKKWEFSRDVHRETINNKMAFSCVWLSLLEVVGASKWENFGILQ